jgi:hypothetical protein
MGARAHGNWWKWSSWSISHRRLLKSTHMTWACIWISEKVARGMIKDWANRKQREYWQSICGQRQAKSFLKKPSAKKKKAGELLNLSRNQLRIMTGLLTGHCQLKGYLFKLQLVKSPGCDRCKHLEWSRTFFETVRLWPH